MHLEYRMNSFACIKNVHIMAVYVRSFIRQDQLYVIQIDGLEWFCESWDIQESRTLYWIWKL